MSQGIHKNISLKTATLQVKKQQVDENIHQNKLVVLFSWLAAKDVHVEKYRSWWINTGFDVLTVKLSPYELMLPKVNMIPVVHELIKFLYIASPIYPNILFHCFSVGSYQFGNVIDGLNDPQLMEAIINATKLPNDPKVTIEKCIKGIIFDSATNLDSFPKGVSRALSFNPLINRPLEVYLKGYLKFSHPFVTKYFIRALDCAYENYLNAPALFFSSFKDPIGTREISAQFCKEWRSRGIDVTEKTFYDSHHVQHMMKYEKEYKRELDDFLKKVSLTS